MTFLSRWRDIGGRPREGMHATRIPLLDIALWKTLLTVLFTIAVGLYMRWPVGWLLIFVFLLAELLHYVFGVRTRVLTAIGAL